MLPLDSVACVEQARSAEDDSWSRSQTIVQEIFIVDEESSVFANLGICAVVICFRVRCQLGNAINRDSL
jgi:hypothetical protein